LHRQLRWVYQPAGGNYALRETGWMAYYVVLGLLCLVLPFTG
jgi:hypothetical protein